MSPEPGTRRWGRHFEGWPLGLWVVVVCLLSALLLVPRDVPPQLLPPPHVDRLQQRADGRAEAERAARGRAGLPLEVRSVAEAFRRSGHARKVMPATLPQRQAQLRRLAAEALERDGPEPLLALRALQSELWLAALRAGSAEPTPDALELGGGLLDVGLARGWFAPPPSGADDAELQTLFRIHWGEELGIARRHPFAPSLNEWRVYYRFLLSRPIPGGQEREGDLGRKLEYVAALAQHDQSYPESLARGILLYWQGSPGPAAAALQNYLERSPDGPWTLRARNHLAACGALLIE